MLVDAQMRRRDACSWIEFLDYDEFLVTQSRESLPDVLDQPAASSTAVLQVQMRGFGNSGHYCVQPEKMTIFSTVCQFCVQN